ncbi:uncharacterized protein BCR38DRAFT_332343 [Pseudomassariella vexata]|uniref:protein-tyrosine-phosphatase n=1 Tax=Pseudomassariella vexata TaxID=1141098 RepID=A0A1Y2EEY2_9PEZI|nr:uncharacterized protein BCR38DRAFT_332343 [Pseudomassariella vexata]ORY70120.1 hypothetical protein BCR38DRAFT_332343 [Pseudomassariella vexata]
MPSAAARRLYEDQLPSFMSIINPEADNFDDRGLVTVVDSKLMEMEPTCGAPQLPNSQHLPLRPTPTDLHRHHDSTSTQNSESADSSPTTTLITDTSSLSDPSPSSSPDSPVNLVPLNAFPATTFGGLSSTMNTLTVNEPSTHRERPMTSPSPRRARNMKGLSIQPPFNSLSSTLVSEPSSPSFIKPKIPGMKRKPSQLSLKTDSNGLNGLNGGINIRPTTLEVPASPGLLPPMLQRRALKHSTSSPHMLSGLKSATFGPAGGMGFPTLGDRGESGLSQILRPSNQVGPSAGNRASVIMEEDSSPIKPQVANRAAIDFEPFHDESEKNEDQKSPGYPDGPIAIYEDNVYLYLEPTAEEAAKFDVVINVAREVLNPFDASTKGKAESEPEVMIESPIPDTAVTTDSFATAFEFQTDERMETPTTPKAPDALREPEYIHMPWDHNTDIATDLMMLCEKIEKRTKEGKKVLVHCQQGASRSASLIIAYGLYQNPGLTVNDAYYRAQSKSRWISPNMRLMYCLQDFQKEVAKKRLPRSAAGPRSGRSPTKYHRLTLSADAIDMKPKEPLTAPLPDEKPGPAIRSSSPGGSPVRSRGKSTSNLEAISPGPSSAPSAFSWSSKEDEKDRGKFGRFDLDKMLNPPNPPPAPALGGSEYSSDEPKPIPSPEFGARRFGGGPQSVGFSSLNIGPRDSFGPPAEKPHEVPVQREAGIGRAPLEDDTLMSPRAETMTNNPLHDSFSEMAGMKFVESPPTPAENLFSPRQTMFPRDPFYPFGRPAQVADPRSPPTKGETPIVRSIDELL